GVDGEHLAHTVRRHQLDAVVDRAQRRARGDPALGDDVVEEGEQVERPRGDVVHGDEGDVAAALVDLVALAVEGDGLLDRAGRDLVEVVGPDHHLGRVGVGDAVQPHVVGELVDADVRAGVTEGAGDGGERADGGRGVEVHVDVGVRLHRAVVFGVVHLGHHVPVVVVAEVHRLRDRAAGGVPGIRVDVEPAACDADLRLRRIERQGGRGVRAGLGAGLTRRAARAARTAVRAARAARTAVRAAGAALTAVRAAGAALRAPGSAVRATGAGAPRAARA